jgi:pimeloyl-ACP methyl ester carboxylesterase
MMQRVLFLPGALGAAEFWRPVGELLPDSWEKVYLSWPGLGSQRPDRLVKGFDDLVRLVERELNGASDLVAQSLGGVVAVRVALRHPEKVRRLVLVATSGGVDVAGLGGAEWRDDYRRNHPGAADWIMRDRPDHAGELGAIRAPTLLLWGDSDPISPVAVGEHPRSLLPNARLQVLVGGTHSFAADRPEDVAPVIAAHLSCAAPDEDSAP